MKLAVTMRHNDVVACSFPHVQLEGKRGWTEITMEFYDYILRPIMGSAEGNIEVSTRRLSGAERFEVRPPQDDYDYWYTIGRANVCKKGLKKFFGKLPGVIYIRKAVVK